VSRILRRPDDVDHKCRLQKLAVRVHRGRSTGAAPPVCVRHVDPTCCLPAGCPSPPQVGQPATQQVKTGNQIGLGLCLALLVKV